MNSKIRLVPDNMTGRVAVPVAADTVLNPGDFVSYESGKAVLLDAATEDATFIGVAEGASGNNVLFQPTHINVLLKAVVEAPVASAAYTVGQALAYNETSGVLEVTATSDSNTIAWAFEDTEGTSVTSLKVLIDVVKLGKLFAVGA
jgi:hypothetical protein